MALLSELASNIKKSIVSALPNALAEEFDLDLDQVKTFIEKQMTEMLGVTGKGKKSPKNKGEKRTLSGYQLFSAATRAEVTKELADLSGKEKNQAIMKELGKRWQSLDEEEKAKWLKKATDLKAEKSAEKEPEKPKEKKQVKKKQENPKDEETDKIVHISDEDSSEEEKQVKKKTQKKKGSTTTTLPATQDKTTKKWILKETQYIFKSLRNKVIVGKLVAGEQVDLTDEDIEECEKNGWPIEQ